MKLKSSGHASLKSFKILLTGQKMRVCGAEIRIADTYSLSCKHIAACIYYYITILLAVVEFSMIFQANHICMYKGILKIIFGTYTRCQQKKVEVTM